MLLGMIYDVIVLGGGAAGVFAAIHAKEASPHASVVLLEKSSSLLGKVRISGGGRCNVTHACFDPNLLVKHYPRGEKELLGPFHRFNPQHTVEWFAKQGVTLKTEEDGRMFPTTDSSSTIIDTLLHAASKANVEIRIKQHVNTIEHREGLFYCQGEDFTLVTKNLILATGSNPQGWKWAEQLGHTITSPVPSLFTFNVPTSPLKGLSGIAVNPVSIHLPGFAKTYEGPLLITHFGFSGPAVLKLSAFGARFLHEHQYHTELVINWLPSLSEQAILDTLLKVKGTSPLKTLISDNPFTLPKNLWKTFVGVTEASKPLAEISNAFLKTLAHTLHHSTYLIEGKTTHKEEFVTCGGVHLKEITFKTMESKRCPRLFFAGEILDIDGITGGFNFQNAWTTGFIAGSASVSP